MNGQSSYTKDNLKILGIVIRSKRLEKGLSLRDLSEITKISHTLISNIEKGKQIPNKTTLKEIMNSLSLEFHNDTAVLDEMTALNHKLLSFLAQFEYEQAKTIMDKLKEKEDIYLYSPQLVNYVILKYLYIALTNERETDIEASINHYSNVIEFFNPLQTQAYYFIVGLNHLNNERYNKATDFFHKALEIGNKEYDVFVKEYLIISMVRQFKFMDSHRIAKEIITEFESKTVYIRAMRVKLQIARVYLVIYKIDDMNEILDQVYNFASKYEIYSLLEEVLLLRAAIAIKLNNLELAEQFINEMPFEKSLSTALLKFRIAYIKANPENLEKAYNEIMKYPDIMNHYKMPNYLTVLTMYKVPSLMDEEIYLRSANELADVAVENNDQEIIGIAYNYLFEFFQSRRQYKKATEVAQKFLQHKKLLRKL